MSNISRRAALLGLAAAGAAGTGLTGCGRGRSTPDPSPPPTSPTPSATPSRDPRPRWPLTGELLADPAKARHAAVAVKVPDNQIEHPQQGIDQADIVFVELEGYRDSAGHSATRLVPVFHSKLPETVEPVRSLRPVDVPLLSPTSAIVGNTGGAGWVLDYVEQHREHLEGMLSYANTEGTGSYGIDTARVYSQNGQNYYDRAVTCHPQVLAKQTNRFADGPPQAYFPIASTPDAVSTATAGAPGLKVQIPYKGDTYAMSYAYDPKTKRYPRSMPWGAHVQADGARISPTNILIIKARQHYGKLIKGSGGAEPLHDIVDADGEFLYFHLGTYVAGTWRKAGVAEPFAFTLEDGSPLQMAPGQTFVELPDARADIRVGT